MFGWTRTQAGLTVFVDPVAVNLSTAQSKVDADCKSATTPVAAEAAYQADRTTLKAADTALGIVLADNAVQLTAANPGV